MSTIQTGMAGNQGDDVDEHAKQHDDEEAPASHRRPCIVMLPSRAATKGMLLHGDVVVIGEARRDDRSPVKVAPLKVKSPHNR